MRFIYTMFKMENEGNSLNVQNLNIFGNIFIYIDEIKINCFFLQLIILHNNL